MGEASGDMNLAKAAKRIVWPKFRRCVLCGRSCDPDMGACRRCLQRMFS